MTTARDAIFQNTPSPDKTVAMEGGGEGRAFRRPSRPSIAAAADAAPVDLLEFTKRALEQSAEKQRALIHADRSEDAAAAAPPQQWPNAIGDTLELSRMHARVLPVEVIELIKDRVERLALSHNNQIFLPQDIAFCSRLYYLNLRWNDFTQFPESVLLLSNLQTLDLSRNKITSIPEEIRNMTSLKFLAFTNNQVTHLPLSFGDMTSLTKLRFDDNPIQFPSADEYLPSPEARQRNGFDSNTYVCSSVKRFMRREKERQRQETESEMSESNLETPKPLKRTNTGRFPVRPSNGPPTSHASGESVFGEGPIVGDPARHYPAPPIPQKSVARDSLAVPPVRRPGVAPLALQGIAHRSRSETVATGSHKLKRHGYVPTRKTSGPPSANSLNRDPSWMKPASVHSRQNSYTTSTVGHDERTPPTSSPQDVKGRKPWMSRSRLSSLPEDRRVSKITSPTIRSARILIYSLDQLNRPIDDAIRVMRSESLKPSAAERLHVNATQNLKELDAQLHLSNPMAESQTNDQDSKNIRAIIKRSRYCVQAYQQVVTEIRANLRKLVTRGDPMYLRALMVQIFACLVEVRNACSIQEQTLGPPPQSRHSNVSQARSDRTVTPTQPKPISKRARGAKIIASLRENSPASATYSNAMPSATSSRTTTMTSMSLATPKSAESFGPNSLSRTTTMTTATLFDSDEASQFEKIYCSIKNVCDLADPTLLNCRQDFFVRREGAARSMASSAARSWGIALTKCDQLMHALDLLKKKLAKVRLNDPANRKSRDFWLVCDGFFNAWYDLAYEMKTLGLQGLDVGSIKPMMRPIQRAIKDASHLVNTSPLVKRCYDSGDGANITLQQHSMPPTPLSAALGPAAQATVPNTPSMGSNVISPAEYFYSNANKHDKERERERERSDTVTSRYGNGKRGR